MHKLGSISAAICASLLLAALAYGDTAPTANKWRIELDGQALSSGEVQFRVTRARANPSTWSPRSAAGAPRTMSRATCAMPSPRS